MGEGGDSVDEKASLLLAAVMINGGLSGAGKGALTRRL
jgi:hypothetical protein